MTSVWFEGDSEIHCDIEHVKSALGNHGEHYVAVIALMPGMTSVELVEQGTDFVTIRTNEGLMKRTNIGVRAKPDCVVVDFDEEYQAGSRVTVFAHYRDEFRTRGRVVNHRTVISGVEARGFLGFLYRTFGSSKMGKACLSSYKAGLEKHAG